MRKSPRVIAATVVTGVIGTTAVWLAPAASAASGPIVVSDPSQVPAAAAEDVVSTYLTPDNPCDTTRSWVLTTPGQHHDATTRVETRWSKEIAAVTAEYHYKRTVPGQKHAAVTGYKYERVVKGHEATQSKKYRLEGTYYTVEHKQVRSKDAWTTAEIDWLKTHAVKVGDGADATSVWTLNDKTVNDANVNPFDYPQGVWKSLGGLNAYGGPSGNGDVEYYITAVELYFDKPTDALFFREQTKTLYYTGTGTGYSTKAVDAEWVSGDAPAGWTAYESRSNNDAVADKPFYYDGTADGTTDPNLAVAQSTAPGAPWVKFGDEVVIKAAYTDPSVTQYYSGADKVPSTTEGDAVYTADPGGEWVAFGEKKEGTGTEAYTVYYNPADPSDTTLDDDNWTTLPADAGPEGWTFVDARVVSNEDGYDDPVVLTTYVYSDGVLCAPQTPGTPTVPGGPVDQFGGAPTDPGPVDQSGGTPATPATHTVPTAHVAAEQAEYDELAHTGSEANSLMPGAAAGLVGGSLLLLAGRRRRQR